MIKIKSALISIYNKKNIDKLLTILKKYNVNIFSTGGTYNYIKETNNFSSLTKVEDITGYPSILGGRVKTLHPKVFGGILFRRDLDLEEVKKYDIPQIDLVVVDLYPFEETVKNTTNESDIIEKIDIGGISLIRAAAKNFNDVVIIPSFEYLDELVNVLDKNNGCTSLEYRKLMAKRAFNVSFNYDYAIFNYFNNTNIIDNNKNIFISENKFSVNFDKVIKLRYGENPHQNGYYFGNLNEIFTQLHGKEISYNNLVDIDSGLRLINEFDDPTFAIIKHTNACGLAMRDNLLDAWEDALAGDPVSAYGGVVFTNQPIYDTKVAEEVNKLFIEVLIAKDYSFEALEILKSKKNRVILKQNSNNLDVNMYKSVLNGCLVQSYDLISDGVDDLNCVTSQKVTLQEAEDLIFANKIVKHTKSNAIVLAKDKQLIGSGTGQTSRVDALKHAIEKAKNFNFDLKGAVMASDAFFPFADCVEIAHQHGITAVIQPGGSIRDNESIEFCNNNNMKMVFTGHRHFKH